MFLFSKLLVRTLHRKQAAQVRLELVLVLLWGRRLVLVLEMRLAVP